MESTKPKNSTNWERSDQPRRQGKERSDHLDSITDEARRDSSDVGSNLVKFVEKWDGTGRKVAKKKIKNTVFSVPR